MEALLTILWFVPSIVFGVGTVITIVALQRAPEGREDERGFRYARPSPTPAPDFTRHPFRTGHSVGAPMV
jgi:hypothetical protein